MKILFINPQGNFDPKDSYLTQHPDFGGQLVYVKETAKALANMGHQVDIVTRKIIDQNWVGFESEKDSYPDSQNLRIIRIDFGGNKFLAKEELWPHINEYVDNIVDFYNREGTKIDFITSHYGDGGIAAALLSDKLNVPYSFTGHSLGAQKLEKMLDSNENINDLNEKYNFNIRLSADRISMNRSSVNIVSTSQERYEQYSHNAYKDIVDTKDDNKFKIITPGVNLKIFNENLTKEQKEETRDFKNFIERDITNNRTNLPFIVASSRLEVKKNHEGIIKAYANNKELQEKCNLMFVIRGVKNPYEDYSFMRTEERKILDLLMSYIDKYNLKGKICFIDIGSQQSLAVLYKYLSRRKSIFALTSLYEPFGLAPLEAMACGNPAVVTKNGGPQEIFVENNEKFGRLVDPFDHLDIANGLLEVLSDWDYYKSQAVKRVLSKYTWESTAKMYLAEMEKKIKTPYFSNIKEIENIGDFIDHISLNELSKYFNTRVPV
ncbi:MAG: glycosyltransferase [Clostridiales bacterium]